VYLCSVLGDFYLGMCFVFIYFLGFKIGAGVLW